MYLSVCGLHNLSPERPSGLPLSDSVITGQHTKVVVNETENKDKQCSFFLRGRVTAHIFTGRETIYGKTVDLSIKFSKYEKIDWWISVKRSFCLFSTIVFFIISGLILFSPNLVMHFLLEVSVNRQFEKIKIDLIIWFSYNDIHSCKNSHTKNDRTVGKRTPHESTCMQDFCSKKSPSFSPDCWERLLPNGISPFDQQ